METIEGLKSQANAATKWIDGYIMKETHAVTAGYIHTHNYLYAHNIYV